MVSVSRLRILFVKRKSHNFFASSWLTTRWYSWGVVFKVRKSVFSEASCPSVGNKPNKSGWISTVFNFSEGLLRILSARLLNSNSANNFFNSSALGSTSFSCSMSKVMGTSVLMVAKNFDILISSTAASTFSRSLPFIWSVCASMFSTVPNCSMSLAAVFSPTPGHPGKLSAESPIKAKRSITWSVDEIPYFWQTVSGLIVS